MNPIQKPYLLLDNFRHQEGWQSCHVKQVDFKEKILFDFHLLPCKFCASRAEVTQTVSEIEEVFARHVQAKRLSSPLVNTEMKGPLVSFNHVHDFAIHEGLIWSRRQLDPEGTWTPLLFDGFSERIEPCALHADGANLVVLDAQGFVHYKKVLREYRGEAIPAEWQELGPYIAVDKATKNNWKTAWFTLPVLCGIVNLIHGKKIRIPVDALAWGISHRGTYNDYYEDEEGNRHPVNTGVTQLYVLLKSGKDIRRLDPWLHPKAALDIQVQDSAESTFTAFNLSPSASTLMLMGYEAEANSKGGTTLTLKVKTLLSDIDTDGYNPGIRYTECKGDFDDPDLRVISKGEWQEHALPENLTGNMTLLQTGEGNQARQLRLEGYDHNGFLGVYHKMLGDHEWQFTLYRTPPIQPMGIKPMQFEEEIPFHSSVHHWIAEEFTPLWGFPAPTSIKMFNFGAYRDTSTIIFYYPEGEEKLILRRKKTVLNHLGLDDCKYHLINCAPSLKESKFFHLFQIFNKREERVTVTYTDSKVLIHGWRFEILFKLLEPEKKS